MSPETEVVNRQLGAVPKPNGTGGHIKQCEPDTSPVTIGKQEKEVKMAGETLNHWETELAQAAGFITATTAKEISEALISTRSRGLLALFNSFQITKLSPKDIPRAVVIDVRRMTKIVVDPVRKTLTCGAGTQIAACDEAAGEHGLAVVAATWGLLRLGGAALGGGYGWLSGQYGLVTDNLLSATVVLADGRVVTASETEYPDLFWGLRGSYTNLGICADFTFRLHEVKDPVSFGILTFKGLDMLEIIYETAMRLRTGRHDVRHIKNDEWNRAISDGKTAFSVRVEFGGDDGTRALAKPWAQVCVVLFHNGPISAAEEIFDPFLNIKSPGRQQRQPSDALPEPLPYTGSLCSIPYKDVNKQLDNTVDHHNELACSVSSGYSVPLTYSTPTAATPVNLLTQLAHSINDTFSDQSYAPKAINLCFVLGVDFRNGREICSPTNADKTSFTARFDGCMCYFRAQWNRDNETEEGRASDQQVRTYIKNTGTRMRGIVHEWYQGAPEHTQRKMPVPAYPGFCSQNDLELKEIFGKRNFERLNVLKEKYDPDQVFNAGFWKGTGGRGN